MARNEGELSEPEDLADDEDDIEDVGDDEDVVVAVADEEEDDESSLEEILAQRASARRAADEPDDDDDIMALTSQREPAGTEPLPTKVVPVQDRQEFVCANCHLVKAKSQLADQNRMLCRDCV